MVDDDMFFFRVREILAFFCDDLFEQCFEFLLSVVSMWIWFLRILASDLMMCSPSLVSLWLWDIEELVCVNVVKR